MNLAELNTAGLAAIGRVCNRKTDITRDTVLADLNYDSLTGVEIAMEFEALLDSEVEDAEWDASWTVGRVIDDVAEQAGVAP